MFPTNTPMPAGALAMPDMVTNLAATLNTSAINQGGGAAPAAPAQTQATAQAPAQTTTTAPAGTANGNLGGGGSTSMDSLIQQFQQQLSAGQGALSSEGNDITAQFNQAISGLQNSTQNANAQLTGYFKNQSTMMQQQQGVAMSNANNNMGTGGLAQNAMSLKMVNDADAQALETLNSQLSSAIASNDNQLQQTVSTLIGQQAQLMLQNKQDIVSNMIAGAGATSGMVSAGAAQSQAATAAAAQKEQAMSDMANLASKYGVTVKAGWDLQDVINAVAPVASEQEKLNLGTMQSQITENNANAALSAAQASIISPMSQDQINSLVTWYAYQPSGSAEQTQVGSQIGAMLANNPKNAVLYANSMDQSISSGNTFDLSSNSGQMNAAAVANMAMSKGLNATDAINQYIVNNPLVTAPQKAALTTYMYAAYGVTPPPANPWASIGDKLSASITGPIESASINVTPGSVNSYATSIYQMGAQQFNRNNPQTASMPGQNPYVTYITGNKNMTYNQYLQSLNK